jgi:2-polyprenyl-6-methoxyphenol hydroxylase-like FAD-dependent oxidoreductase
MDGAGVIQDWDVAIGSDNGTVEADVAIVGAGLAGSILALVLARRGLRVAVVDLHARHRSDFRCEKFNAAQIDQLERLGVRADIDAEAAAAHGLADGGFRYEAVVNAVRRAWPATVQGLAARVSGLGVRDGRQTVLSKGREIANARLVVIASGPGHALPGVLGFERTVLRAQHSLCLGFSVVGAKAPASGLVHAGERAGDRVGFASLFPVDEAMRVNLFTYHDPADPWLRRAKADPIAALLELAPGLEPVLQGAALVGAPELRFTDLHTTPDPARAGVVLIGDAYQTACPATGLGVTRLLTDIERLVERLPLWLANPEIEARDIADYYADPIKRQTDRHALRRAERARRAAVEVGAYWRARRLATRLKVRSRRASVARPPQARFAAGDRVAVRAASEILATLDTDLRLGGLPFMPEMAALVGQTFTVVRRADPICVEGHGLRGMDDAVLLEAQRCDGAAHDGCQRACLMVWKEAWLRPAHEDAPAVDARAEQAALARLTSGPVKNGERYLCQSTLLAGATRPLDTGSVGLLARNLKGGELTLPRALEIVLRALAKRGLKLLGRLELGMLTGTDGKAQERLDLQPGERVRIRDTDRIASTLDPKGYNRGLAYEAEMSSYAGKSYTVGGRIDRIIHEETGKMVTLKATVKLEGLNCQGRCALNCGRANPLYWREAWLERQA